MNPHNDPASPDESPAEDNPTVAAQPTEESVQTTDSPALPPTPPTCNEPVLQESSNGVFGGGIGGFQRLDDLLNESHKLKGSNKASTGSKTVTNKVFKIE